MRKHMTNDRSVVQITATGSFTTKANCHRTARTLRSDRKWEAQENEGDMVGGEGGATPQENLTNSASPQEKSTKHRHRNNYFQLHNFNVFIWRNTLIPKQLSTK